MRSRSFAAVVFFLFSIAAYGQDEDYNAIAAHYENENAVLTNNSEHLVIDYKDGSLSAVSYVIEERLLISSVSPGMYNTQDVYHSYFNRLDDITAEALIPGKRGYKKIKATDYKTTSSERENVFYDDAKQTEVTFPGLVQNAITRINYTIVHKDLHFLPVFYFQNYTPIVKSKFEITVPKFVNLKFVIKGQGADKIKQTVKETGDAITYTWVTNDVPSIKSYNDAPPLAYYALHIIPFIASYKLPDANEETHVLGNPDDLYHYYYQFIKNVNQKDDEQLDKIVADITKGDVTPLQKAAHIYQWVQKNMHYVAFEDKLGGFIPREAADICKRKFGDCKDMTSIQVAMCRKAGINAYFTWIGTRDKPYTYEETPLPMADNHMICTIHVGDKWIFMDGTDPLIPFGVPPSAIQGKEAMVGIDANTYKILKVPERPAGDNMVSDSTFIRLNGNNIVGTTTIAYTGYCAWNIGEIMMYRNKDEKEKTIRAITSRGSDKFMQQSFDYNIADNERKDVSVASQFEVKDYAQNIAKEYYVNMNLLRSYADDVLTPGRTVPIEHSYKDRTKQVVVMDIPKGYHVSYLPPDKEKNVNGLFSYRIAYRKTDKQVQLVKEFEQQALYTMPNQFSDENKLVDDLKKQYKESVVLTAN